MSLADQFSTYNANFEALISWPIEIYIYSSEHCGTECPSVLAILSKLTPLQFIVLAQLRRPV